MDSLVNLTQHYQDTDEEMVLQLADDKRNLKGPVNLIARLAQMLLYSRASNIVDFLNNTTGSTTTTNATATLSQSMSKLVPWIAWERTIRAAFHSDAARQGVGMLNFIVQQLEDSTNSDSHKEQHKQEQQQNRTTGPTTLVFIFGHDTDLNALQTVLNVEWSLPWYGPNSPTPPSTAMHFHQRYYSKKNDNGTITRTKSTITLDLLYPTYFSNNDNSSSNNNNEENDMTAGNFPNTSGILERLHLRSFRDMPALKRVVTEQLAAFHVAIPCFIIPHDHFAPTAATATDHSSVTIPISNDNHKEDSTIWTVGLVLLFTVLLLSLVVVPTARWLQRWKRSRRLHYPFPETAVTATSTTYTQAAAAATTSITDIELL